ncbi:MAG: hypothetical protein KDC53_24525 [Saprospiraceae bacterium]|nr:hypothetical protein [Saprospiraceae bacterium]
MKFGEDQTILKWRIGQIVVWSVGFAIFNILIFLPKVGLHLFWDILIPMAPAIIVVVPGLWRNVCPMSISSLASSHLGWSKKRRLSRGTQSRLSVLGVVLLLMLIPLRHGVFNTSGYATALLLLILTTVAFTLGRLFDWKSAWCNGMCPVHQVERLYGHRGRSSFANAHCDKCYNCSIPCPDSLKIPPTNFKEKMTPGEISLTVLCGGFPGYIWGWFQVKDLAVIRSFVDILNLYYMPVLGFTLTLVIYLIIRKWGSKVSGIQLTNIFSALAISTYYWYRIPALVGFGVFPADGRLIDFSSRIPPYLPVFISSAICLFFFWWFLRSPKEGFSWLKRPEYARR